MAGLPVPLWVTKDNAEAFCSTVRRLARSALAAAFASAVLILADAGKSEEAMMWTQKSSGGLTTPLMARSIPRRARSSCCPASAA